jgi:hypothetical protein
MRQCQADEFVMSTAAYLRLPLSVLHNFKREAGRRAGVAGKHTSRASPRAVGKLA